MYIFLESTDYRLSNNVWHHIFQKSIASQPKLKAWKEPHKFFMKLESLHLPKINENKADQRLYFVAPEKLKSNWRISWADRVLGRNLYCILSTFRLSENILSRPPMQIWYIYVP